MDLKYITNRNLRILLIAGICLFFFRIAATGDVRFVFLNWNIFLAWLPYYLAKKSISSKENWVALFLTMGWLFVLPNSFYIFTDLIHLQWSHGHWWYYDTMLITVYAVCGTGYGFLSIHLLQEKLNRFFQAIRLDHVRGLFVLFLLCSFGVYIGRIGRWNSWDLLFRPLDVFQYTLEITRLSDNNLDVFVFTGLFWLFLVVVYSAIHPYSNELKKI